MRICVIGLGYIGLPTALMLASKGLEVVGIDYSEEVVSELQAGELTFEEEGLEGVFQSALDHGIRFSTSYEKGDLYIVAVPTPYDPATKRVDAGYVEGAVGSILDVCDDGAIIVIESTIPPGTIDAHIRPLLSQRGSGRGIHLAHAPERIIPGNMIAELVENSRTIGADSAEIAEKVKEVYASFCEADIAITDIRTAEMSKVVENTFRDVNIAYANELAKICRSDDLDVYEVIRIANKHPRVSILSPGPGVGGHCISVDPWFLVGDYPELVDLIRTARHINDSMPDYVLDRAFELMESHGIDDVSKVGFYGLTYKENVDDVRESPTLQLYRSMQRHLAGGHARFYDPYITDDIVGNQYHDLASFLEGLQLVVVMVAHDQVIENAQLLADKLVLDTRHCLSGANVEFL